MTLSTWSDSAQTSDATFRASCLAFDTAIKAVGCVQTADTGQINFSTVLRPTTTTTTAGYAIYSFNDALQGSYPCYIKITFGTGSAGSVSNWGVSITIQIATSTNGAGVMGAIQSPAVWMYAVWYTGGPWLFAASGSSSRLTLAPSYNYGAAATVGGFCSIERIQDTSGADTNTGLVFTWMKNITTNNTYQYNGQQVLYFSGTQPAAFYNSSGMVPALFPYNSVATPTITAWQNLNQTYTSPLWPIGKTLHPPIQGFLIGFPTDFPNGPNLLTNGISLYGTPRSWMVIPNGGTYVLTWSSANTGTLLVRWD